MTVISPGGAPDKRAAVRAMFERIADRYDLMNTVMTFGRDGYWRRRAARIARLPEGGTALDIGTGTGDLACALARAASGAHIVGLDNTPAMLARAPAKARRRQADAQTTWLRADGQCLPFRDGTFDAVASAFVLRNLTDLDLACREMARVLRPGGRVVALEISPEVDPGWRRPFAWYFDKVVPRLGSLIAGDWAAYEYLPRSVAAFLTPAGVADRMRAAGLVPLTPSRLLFGSVVIHVAVKPAAPDPRRGGPGVAG